MIGIVVKIEVVQLKLFANNVTKFGAPGNRTPLEKDFLILVVSFVTVTINILIIFSKLNTLSKYMKGYTMKKIAIILSLLFLTNSAFAGSCPMMAQNIDSKIEEAQKLRDAGMAAHDAGDHSKSEELLNKALELFKS